MGPSKFHNLVLGCLVDDNKTKTFQLSRKSPCLHLIFGPPFTPYPLFQWCFCKEILLNLSMKCRNSAFNAQGPRVIIVVVQVGAGENICSSSVGVHEKGQTRLNYFNHQFFWFCVSPPPSPPPPPPPPPRHTLQDANVLVCRVFLSLAPWMKDHCN